MPSTTGPTIAAPDDDPYLWLEEIERPGGLATAFADRQSKADAGKIGTAGFAADRTRWRDLRRPDNNSVCKPAGGFLDNLWKDASSPAASGDVQRSRVSQA